MTDLSREFLIERLQHEETGKHFARVSFDKIGGGRGHLTVPLAVLDDPRALMGKLRNEGAPIELDQRAELLELVRKLPQEVCCLLVTSGWKMIGGKPAFAVADRLLGVTQVKCYVEPRRTTYAGPTAGTLSAWRGGPAKLALRSDTATFAMLVAFGAVIARFANPSEGALFNLAGPSSSGKSTALLAAASVFGGTALPGWDMTDQARSELAAASNDIAAIMDDPDRDTKGTPETRLRKLLDVADPLTSGEARRRSTIVQDQLPDLRFNFFGLSSSQESVESFTRAKRIPRSDGNRVRLLEYSTPRNALGIWASARTKPGEDGSTLSMLLRAQCERSHGTAGPAFVSYIIDHYEEVKREVPLLCAQFMDRLPPELNAWERRIAQKCAVLYAAGKVASRAKVLPIKKGETLRITRAAFLNIVNTAFGQPDEIRSSAAALLTHLEDSQSFPRVSAVRDIDPDADWAGFFCRTEKRVYMRSGSLEKLLQLGEGSSSTPKSILNKLATSGALLQGHGSKATQNKRVGRRGRNMRLLVFDKARFMTSLKDMAGSPSDGPASSSLARSDQQSPPSRRVVSAASQRDSAA